MNWMGGAARRAQGRKNTAESKQRQFFEGRKRQVAHLSMQDAGMQQARVHGSGLEFNTDMIGTDIGASMSLDIAEMLAARRRAQRNCSSQVVAKGGYQSVSSLREVHLNQFSSSQNKKIRVSSRSDPEQNNENPICNTLGKSATINVSSKLDTASSTLDAISEESHETSAPSSKVFSKHSYLIGEKINLVHRTKIVHPLPKRVSPKNVSKGIDTIQHNSEKREALSFAAGLLSTKTCDGGHQCPLRAKYDSALEALSKAQDRIGALSALSDECSDEKDWANQKSVGCTPQQYGTATTTIINVMTHTLNLAAGGSTILNVQTDQKMASSAENAQVNVPASSFGHPTTASAVFARDQEQRQTAGPIIEEVGEDDETTSAIDNQELNPFATRNYDREDRIGRSERRFRPELGDKSNLVKPIYWHSTPPSGHRQTPRVEWPISQPEHQQPT